MLSTFRTLIAGSNARAEENLRDVYSIELIEQKIREATNSLKAAKVSLAGLIQRKRSEERQATALHDRIGDLMLRTKDALKAGEDTLASEAASAIATMENELALRRATIQRLETRVLRLEASVETAHRRLVDLKQGAIAAKSMKREQQIQTRLGRAGGHSANAMDEAEELIEGVMKRDDPFEQSEILREIETGLNHDSIADRMAAKGLGPSTKTTATDVLARFK
ncbi:MAG: PspA/IM30 family protein [Aliishimia sp.]